MPIEQPVRLTAAPLTDVLRQLALDIAQAQAALDLEAEAQMSNADERESPLPPLAFFFPELEVDLCIAFSLARFQQAKRLVVAPADPQTSGFFQTISFSSRLRARIAPRIQLTLTAVANSGDFGDVCVGKFRDLSLTMDNRGNQNLCITAITSSSQEFQPVSLVSFPLVLRPGASAQIPIRFRPTTTGAKSATITITSNDLTGGFSHTVAVVGNAPPSIIVFPALIEFDKMCIGSTQTRMLPIGNSSACDLIVTNVSSSSPEFRVIGIVPFPLVIPPGSKRDVAIQFIPVTSGSQTATLTITSNDLNNPSVKVMVKGLASPLMMQVIPDPLNFDRVCLGAFKDLPLTIKNMGECHLTLSGITSSSTDFKFPTAFPFPVVIAPGEVRDVPIRFEPAGAGAKSAQLTVNGNDSAAPMVTVTTIGVAAVSDIEINGLTNFGSLAVGKFRDQVLNIINSGPCDILITQVCEVKSNGIAMPSTEFNVVTILSYPVLIPSGGTLPLMMRFKPEFTGPRTANFIVFGHDPKNSSAILSKTVPLIGKGKSQEGIV